MERNSSSPAFPQGYILGIDYYGLPNGYEQLTVSPAVNSMYDAAGNVASTTQSNNVQSFTEEKIRELKFNEHNTAYGVYNSLVQVDTNTYALAYAGNGSDGYMQTFTIPTHGRTITKVATLEHDVTIGTHNSLCKVDADTYLLAFYGYRGNNTYGGYLRTFTIPADGSSITAVATHRFVNGSNVGQYNSVIQLDADTYVLATMGAGSDGFIQTYTVSADGSTITLVATLEHDTADGKFNSLVKVDANTVALAYAGSSNQGWIKTFTIPADGSSITQVATKKHDSIQGLSLIHI